jgi:transaldolase
MAKNPLFQLGEYGQSVWFDDISRPLVRGDGLQKLIDERAVVGVTSNPSIFEKAIAATSDYDDDLRRFSKAGLSPEEIFMELALDDVARGLDTLKPAYEGSGRIDGRVSMEVLASLAYETARTQTQVRDIWKRVNRENLMIKIPATREGVPAIEEMLYEGHSINITLIFGIDYYRQVMEAYVKALERRAAEGKDISRIGSVASFFVSRVDTKVDKRLDSLVEKGELSSEDANRLKGKAANANAKLAYAEFKKTFQGPRFAPLSAKGARVQRPLWASTSTKNRAYPDTLYVEDLVGRDTVNTMPRVTLDAYADHGQPRPDAVEEGVADAGTLFSQLEEIGVDMQQVTEELVHEGVKTFADAFDKLLHAIREKTAKVHSES